MKNYVLKIAYDGTAYFGWQTTKMGPSIESTLQAVLETILQHSVTLQAASRTDRGVHAEAQWVNFFSEKELATPFQNSVNALLPPTVRVLEMHRVANHFHPTLHALSKEYHYKITLGKIQMPSKREFYWHVPSPLDLTRMQETIPHFLKKQDFSSLCNVRKNMTYKDKIREITALTLVSPEPQELLVKVEGDHFLYKMVRNLVGTLVQVGLGKIDPAAIPEILRARSRPEAGMTAPAHGLILKKISYPEEFFSQI